MRTANLAICHEARPRQIEVDNLWDVFVDHMEAIHFPGYVEEALEHFPADIYSEYETFKAERS